MLARQERMAFLLLAIVTGIVLGGAAILEAIGRVPFATPYDRSLPDGTLVLLEGEVQSITHTREGGHMLLRVSGATVFVPSDVRLIREPRTGDRVRLLGFLHTYRGEREVVIRAPEDIVILD